MAFKCFDQRPRPDCKALASPGEVLDTFDMHRYLGKDALELVIYFQTYLLGNMTVGLKSIV